MKIQKNKYWLILEPTVEINLSKNSVLLYDTLTKNKLVITDDEVIKLIIKLQENGFVISYNKDNIKKQIKIFISQLLDNYMGDIIPINHSKIKPIQLTNIINIQNDIEKIQKHKGISYTDNIITNLREINLYLNNYDNHAILKNAFKQFLYCSENYTTDSYINYNQLLSFFSNINLKN